MVQEKQMTTIRKVLAGSIPLTDAQKATITLVRTQSRDVVQKELLVIIDHVFACIGGQAPGAPAPGPKVG